GVGLAPWQGGRALVGWRRETSGDVGRHRETSAGTVTRAPSGGHRRVDCEQRRSARCGAWQPARRDQAVAPRVREGIRMGMLGQRMLGRLAELLPAPRGVGPLLQRDYWGVIVDCRLSPSEVIDLVARRFPDFAPAGLAAFRRLRPNHGPLDVGDELEVHIRMTGTFRV